MQTYHFYKVGEKFSHKSPNMFWRTVTIIKLLHSADYVEPSYNVLCMPLWGLPGDETLMRMGEDQITNFLKPFTNGGQEDTSVF